MHILFKHTQNLEKLKLVSRRLVTFWLKYNGVGNNRNKGTCIIFKEEFS